MKKISSWFRFLLLFIALFAGISFTQSGIAYAKDLAIESKVAEMTSEEKEFSLDKIIVQYKDGVSKSKAASRMNSYGNKEFAANLGSNKLNAYAVALASNEGKLSGSSKSTSLSASEKSVKIDEIRDLLAQYLADPTVESAQPVYAFRTSAWTTTGGNKAYPSDWNSTNHWYYEKEKVREMWYDQNCQGAGANCGGSNTVVVAVIDTGVAYENRTSNYLPAFLGDDTAFDYDIASELVAYNFHLWTNTSETGCEDGDDDDGNGVIDDCHSFNAYEYWACAYIGCTGTQVSEEGHANDDFGHGTYVTGLIAGVVDNAGTPLSPALNVTIMPVKGSERITHAFDPSAGPAFWSDDLCNAMAYAAMEGADVINMSLGSPDNDPFIEACVADVVANYDVVLVAASGNDGASTVSYPAALPGVIAVGASDSSDNRATYSNYGSALDIVAAVGDTGVAGNATWQQSYGCFATATCGTNVATNFKSFSNQFGMGTSYASPQVAAAAAIIVGNNPGIAKSFVEYGLINSTTDITAYGTGWDSSTGYGIIDFEKINAYVYDYTMSGFYSNGGKTSKPVATVEFSNKLYQVIKGYSSNNIFIRSTADGVFDNSAPSEDWLQIPGQTVEQVSLTAFNPGDGNKLYMTIMGTSGSIYIRSTTDGTTWTDWSQNGGKTSASIATATFSGRMYQSIKGSTSNNIFLRSTGDGLFDGLADGSTPDTLENWVQITGQTPSAIELASFGSNLYMTVRGNSSEIFTRSSANGSTWTAWSQNGGKTSQTPSMAVFDSKLYQSVKGNSTDYLFMRYTADGTNWYTWYQYAGTSPMRTNIQYFSVNNTLYETVVGNSGSIFIRTLTH